MTTPPGRPAHASYEDLRSEVLALRAANDDLRTDLRRRDESSALSSPRAPFLELQAVTMQRDKLEDENAVLRAHVGALARELKASKVRWRSPAAP